MEVILFIVFILILIGIAAILLNPEYRKEVTPTTALVYNNKWNGEVECILPGTEFISPGVHTVLEAEVSLLNEAQNPNDVKLVTADGIEIDVDFIMRHFRVGYRDMPPIGDPAMDTDRLKACIIQAATAISYKDRTDKVLTRVIAILQASIERRTLNELFPGTDINTGKIGKVDNNLMSDIEQEVNIALRTDIVTTEWGFWVEIDLEDYNLPAEIRKARERRSSAEISGKALKDKAQAAGIRPEWFVLGEAISDIFSRNNKKGDDK